MRPILPGARATAAWLAVALSFSPWLHAEPLNLRVMSFNVKNGSPSQENKWEDRRPVLKNAILSEDPDLIGTQEIFFFQIKHVEEDLPQYAWVGLGRAGGSKDEYMAIFYKKDRLELMAYDHFWLSDTPEVIGSRTWGHDNRRMVTWARFRERGTGREFYHWNTHFDHRVQEAREKSAELVLRRIRETQPTLPVVVTGDFNADQNNVVHEMMLSRVEGQLYLRDAWDIAGKREGEQVGTFHNWRGTSNNDRRIDWVLVSPEFECARATVVTYEEKGQWPSDHFPVVCDLVLGE